MMETHRLGAARSRAAVVALALSASGLLVASAPPARAQEPAPAVPTTHPLRAIDGRSAALLISGQQGGDLDLRLLAVGAPVGWEKAGAIDVVLEIAGAGLAAELEVRAVPLAVHLYAIAPGGEVAAILREGVEIGASELGRPGRAGVKLLARLRAPAGEYELRALATRTDDGRFGLVLGRVTVPPPGEPAPAVVALEPTGRWVVARTEAAAGKGPFSGGSPAASAAPVFAPGDLAGLPLALRDAHPVRGFRVGLAGDAERELALGPATGGGDGWYHWAVRPGAGAVPAGDYRLELSAPDTGAVSAVPLRVAAADTPANATWTDLGDGAPPPAAAADAGATTPIVLPAESLDPKALEGAYVDAIGRFAAGDSAGALTVLLAAEAGVLGDDAGERFGRYLETQLQVAGDLAAVDHEALLPLVRLHELAYDAYLERGSLSLAARSRRLAVRLALGYAERSERKEREASRARAARAIETIADRVLRNGGRVDAARLFLDAIELDPKARTSLLAVSMLLEFGGQYAEALGYLERAATLPPADPALALRVAVHRARTGDAAGAERAFRAGLEEGPEWTRTVAAQELAKLLVARGARDEATALLEHELELRNEPGVRIELAALLDAADRRREAARLLAGLESSEHAEVDSPRLRYDRVRRLPEIEESRKLYEAAVAERLPALAEAHRDLVRKLRREEKK